MRLPSPFLAVCIALSWCVSSSVAAKVPEPRVLAGHKSGVSCVAFSPDGATLASSASTTITVWNVKKGKKLRSFGPKKTGVGGLAFSPDGSMLASARARKEDQSHVFGAILWKVANGKRLKTLSSHTAYTTQVVFGPQPGMLTTAGRDGMVKLWNIAQGKEVGAVKANPHQVLALAFTSNGKNMAAAGGSFMGGGFEVRIFEIGAGARPPKELVGHKQDVLSLAFTPDGSALASGDSKGQIIVWNTSSAKAMVTFKAETGRVRALAFHPKTFHLLACRSTGTMQVYDVKAHKELVSFTAHRGGCHDMAVQPGGALIATSGADKLVKLWPYDKLLAH